MDQRLRKKGMGYVILLAGILLMLLPAAESRAAVKKPGLSKKKLCMVAGKQERLSVKNKKGYMVSWKSSKRTVATVSETGKIKAKKSGAARITAVVKANQGGKTYRLVCKVSVKRGKKQGNTAGEKTDSAKNVNPSGNPTVRLTEDPGSTASGSSSVTSDSAVSDQPVSKQPTLDPKASEPPTAEPAVPEQPIPGKPADSTTGSAVISGEAKLLFGNYNDGLPDGNFFGNQIVASYEQLQNLIQKTREEMAGNTWQPGCDRLQWYINQMETIGEDYFSDHVLCINTMSVARGYEYILDSARADVGEDGTKILHLCLRQHYNVKGDESVTCDMPYYSYFIQLPKELIQDCETVVCSLVEGGKVVPSGDPEHPYLIQDVLRILEQVCYPVS